MDQQYQLLPIRSVNCDSVMILDAIDRYLPPLPFYRTFPTRNQQSTRLRTNYVEPRMTTAHNVAYVDGHHIFHVMDSINHVTQLQSSSTTNLQAHQTQHFYHNFQRIRIEETREESEPCSVCLVDFSVGSNNAIQLSCSHVYHQDCIMKWLHRSNTCPLCRRTVSEVP